MRYAAALIGLTFALCLVGCGEERRERTPASPPAATVVPNLEGENLDEAEERLDSLGIGYSVDSGDDEVVFEHLWTVCYQSPEAGSHARFVELTVEHICDDYPRPPPADAPRREGPRPPRRRRGRRLVLRPDRRPGRRAADGSPPLATGARRARRHDAVRDSAARGRRAAAAHRHAAQDRRRARLRARGGAPPTRGGPAVVSADELLARVDDLERRLEGLQSELYEVRRLARAARVAAPEPEPWAEPVVPPPPAVPPAPEEWWQDERGRWRRGPRPEPVEEPAVPRAAAPPSPPAEEAKDFVWDRELRLPDLADLFGAKALAWAGGVVTLLGVVFFFVLAVNRGWIGPGTRVGLGAAASLIVFAAGLVLERRYGALYSALAAVGAGIAGGYATLLAATALYDMLPDWGALIAAAAIAALGLVVSLLWSSEIVAGIGLVGAMAVPAFLVLQGGPTTTGTAFVAVVFAAAAATAAREEWPTLLVVSVAVSIAQAGALVLDSDTPRWSRFAVAAVFWALYLAAALGWQLRVVGERLASLAASLIVLSAGFAVLSAAWLLHGSWGSFDKEGLVLAVAALGYGASAAVFFLRPGARQLAVLLGVTGLAVGAIAVADLVSGASLTYAWAAEGALLAWLAWRIAEARFQLASFAYLALALGHALAFESRLDRLFDPNRHPGRGAPTIAALAAAAAIAAWFAREPAGEAQPGEGVLSFLAQPLEELRKAQPVVRRVLAAAAGVLGIYALSLAILELFELGADDVETWFDRGHVVVSAAWAVVGLAVVVAGLYRGTRAVTIMGLAWLGLTLLKRAVYGALAAGAFRLHRDLSTLLWALALVVAAGAEAVLVSGGWLTLAWAASAAALTWLAVLLDEERLQVAALGYLVVAFGWTILEEAPPNALVNATAHPAEGIGSVVLVAAATALFARLCLFEDARWRTWSGWVAGIVVVYGLSLAILELAQLAPGGDLKTNFQRGHTGVSAFWGALGLALLYVGLTRRLRVLRLGGFALFGVSLAKLFLYDLAFLNSVARALSFLAVGAVLLLGEDALRLLDDDARVERALELGVGLGERDDEIFEPLLALLGRDGRAVGGGGRGGRDGQPVSRQVATRPRAHR